MMGTGNGFKDFNKNIFIIKKNIYKLKVSMEHGWSNGSLAKV